LKQTPLYDKHVSLNARMVEFAGWEMPVQYPTGIVEEHLQTRKNAGLFDISHMGRFSVSGAESLSFLQKVLTNNAAALEPGKAQYTMIANERGGAVDDAYLYCLDEQQYLLVVNAANRDKDWDHFQEILPEYAGIECRDRTEELAMLSVQGPRSREIVLEVLGDEALPEPGRNNLTSLLWNGKVLHVARTGYTGEPIGFEVFLHREQAETFWDAILQAGAAAIGLGARDTLRLEAGLPLYGHELGSGPDGREMQIFSCLLARFAVSFSSLKGQYIGREPLLRQFEAYRRIVKRDYSDLQALPRLSRRFTLLDRGVARQGAAVFSGERQIGWVTSGTMAPYWIFEGEGLCSEITERSDRRAIGIAILDSSVEDETEIEIDVRGKRLRGLTVPYLLRAEAPPFARPIFFGQERV